MAERVAETVKIEKAGMYDGDEFGNGECTLYLYGPDADRLMMVVSPLFREWELAKGGYAVKRYGPPGSRTATVELR
jgi:hypothetical protein